MAGPPGSDVRGLPLPVFRLEPPYAVLHPLRELASVDPGQLARGTILVIAVDQLPRQAARAGSSGEADGGAAPAAGAGRYGWVAAALADCVRTARSRFPACPLVLRLGAAPERGAVAIGRYAAELHVRAILLDGDEAVPTLRKQLTDSEHLAGDVLAWLPYRGVRLSRFARLVIEEILVGARQHQPLRELLPSLRVGGESKIRDRFREEGLPSPHKWRRLAEALYAVLRVQQQSGSLFTSAVELGYSEGPSLSHQVRGVFGVPPGEIKETIGWECWMDAWFRGRRAKGDFASPR